MKIHTPTLVLGLGGTGFHIVSKIKQLVKDNGIANNNAIKFLCLDFDSLGNNRFHYSQKFGQDSLITSNEYNHVSIDDIETPYKNNIAERHPDFFESTGDKDRLTNLLSKIDKKLNVLEGAGQTRINGKIAVSHSRHFEVIDEELNKVPEAITGSEVTDADNLQKVKLFVFCSSSGASGSGMLLDILFMLIKGNYGKTVSLYDFIVLPDAYVDEYGDDDVRPFLAYPNTYGLLTEIDYLEHNSYVFRPTSFTENEIETLSKSEQRSPDNHFLIDNDIYKGARNLSLRNVYEVVANFCIGMILPGYASSEKNFKTESAANKGKKGIFGSIGYAEITFNFKKFKEFTLQSILKKAEIVAKNGLGELNGSEQPTGSNDLWENGIVQLENLLKNAETNFLKQQYLNSLNELSFNKPLYNKKTYFSALEEKVSSEINSYKKNISQIVSTFFETNESFESAKDLLINSLKYANQNKFDIQKANILEKLKDLNIELNADDSSIKNEKESNISQLIRNNLTSYPKKGKYKHWLWGIKSTFFTEHLKGVLDRIETNLVDSRDIQLRKELFDRIKNEINNKIKQPIENYSFNYEVVGHNLVRTIINKPIDMSAISGTSIRLEGYLKNKINQIIASENISEEIYMKCMEASTESELYTILSTWFDDINSYNDKDIDQLLEELTEPQREQIRQKLKDLRGTLWNRDDNDTIKNGERSNRKGYENHNWETKSKHKKSYFSLDIGIAGHNVRNIDKYRDEYHSIIEEKGEDEAVKYFAYDKIKLLFQRGKIGIYKVDDIDEFKKKERAIDIWAQGWALGCIQKSKSDRYRFHLRTDFEPDDENQHLFNTGIYDLFKNDGFGLDIIKMFDKFKNDYKLLDYLERLFEEEKNKEPRQYLEKIRDQFNQTSTQDFTNKYLTQKKAYTELLKNGIEKDFVIKEGVNLKEIAINIASDKSIDIKFKEEPDASGRVYQRLEFI